jgi:hypothetical protein
LVEHSDQASPVTPMSDDRPRLYHRLAVAIGVAIAAAAIAAVKIQQNGLLYDYGYLWVAGRAVLSGTDPYAAVRPGVMHFDNWFMYPMPAAIAGATIAWMPMGVASVVFVALAMGSFAFALTGEGWRRLPILMSFPALWAMTTGQWSPFVTAAFVSPAFAWAAVCKPTLGAVAFVTRPKWKFIWVSAATIAISLLWSPTWPMRWWETTQKTANINYEIPITVQGGFLLALAAIRWRYADARLLLGMACVPQSMLMYDQLPLMLIARSRLEAIAFSLWTYLAPLAMRFVTTTPTVDTKAETLPYLARIITWTLYLPALAVVLLRKRPAEER